MASKTLILILLFFAGAHSCPDEKYYVRFLQVFPEQDKPDTGFSSAQALAVNPEGEIFVVDTGSNRIIKYDKKGKFVQTVGGFGWEAEQFDRPLDITAKTGLDVFIADYNNERIERYDNDLNYISSLYSNEAQPEDLRFGFPTGVDISKHGELFICDSENNRILKLDVNGRPLLSFGGYNWGQGEVNQPGRIVIGSDDRVFVTDLKSAAIYVFDYYGNFLSKTGGKTIAQPAGLAVSHQGLLFVCDSGADRVVVFSGLLREVFAWGQTGDGLGAFQNPIDVAVDKDRVFVLDSGNNRIQVFQFQMSAQ